MSFFKRRFLILFLLIGFVVSIQAQVPADKLNQLLTGLDYKHQVRVYDSLAGYYRNENAAVAAQYSNKGVEVSNQNNYEYGVARCLFTRAKVYAKLGNYKNAEKDLNDALLIFIKQKNEEFIISCYTDFGNMAYTQGQYDQAIGQYIKGLRLSEKIASKEMQAKCLNNIGNVYFVQANFDKAIDYYKKAYEINKDLGDNEAMALTLDNIGLVYINKEEYELALFYQTSALKVVEKMDNKQFLAETLMNLGSLSMAMGKKDTALSYFQRAYEIHRATHSDYGMASCLINLGSTYTSMNRFPESINALTEGLTIAKNINSRQNMKEALFNLSETYEKMHQPERALAFYKMYSELKDSIFNEESSDKINDLTTKYDMDKKQQEIELLTMDKDLNDVKLKNQRTLNISLLVGIVLVIAFLLLIVYRYQEKRKANVLLEEKSVAIQEQKELLFLKNREITDSINYARRIQDAMLPSQKIVDECIEQNFIYYLPKDIISGDFYWATRYKDNVYIAVADCTGHGVPGALMSMIGMSFLRQIINENGVTDTAEVLSKLHAMVIHALNEDVSARRSKDGMDMALVKLDINSNTLQFSGAVRPLYVLRNGQWNIIKGDRYSIAGEKNLEEQFSRHTIDLESGASYYLFSDGIVDQFGGEKGKKFMTKNLQNVLESSQSLNMREQCANLAKAFENWKGDTEQTDDVLVIGFKV